MQYHELPDDFTRAYVQAALWSTNDNADDRGGEPLDKNYGCGDIADEAIQTIIADCKRFQEENAEAISTALCRRESGTSKSEQAGHDFWLTRNGHGCGFWDGDWSDPEAKKLDEASKLFGEVNLYVGDDGKIYC